VPSVRFSRDKRGYEYVYLVHTPTRRGKPGRTRVLYWYRTPPGVRIGRRPFDEEVQRTLERQNPGVEFAWDAIINTPMPPPDMTEYWRERRRADKAARQERRAVDAETDPAPELENGSNDESAGPHVAFETAPEAVAREQVVDSPEPASAPAMNGDVTGPDEGQGPRKRRRRRGGRRRRGAGVDSPGQDTASAESTPESVESPETADLDGQSGDEESASEEK
jgi:hypothetical protein